MNVCVPELISFFDEDRSARPHASAIKAVAGEELGLGLLMEYFRRNGIQTRLLDQPCTTGQRQGYQLDGWIEIPQQANSSARHYQVEVKSWSFHGVGPGSIPLPLHCTPEELSAYKKRVWGAYWSDGYFSHEGLNKVLTPMKPPEGAKLVIPLACVWAAMHPNGDTTEFFKVPLSDQYAFPYVEVFSMSAFLRNLEPSESILSLEVPWVPERLKWLSRLFPQ